MLSTILLFATIAFIVHLVYKWATKNSDYFAKRGLKYMDSNYGIGQMTGFLMGHYSQMEFVEWLYKQFPGEE